MSFTKEDIQTVAFTIILHAGDARTQIHEAFGAMREKKFQKAEAYLKTADESLVLAHQSQTELLTAYATEEEISMEIILVHAQDHLMTTMTLLEVAQEMLLLRQELNGKSHGD